MKPKQQKRLEERKERKQLSEKFVYLCPSCPNLHPVPDLSSDGHRLLRPCDCPRVFLTVRCPHGSILQYICPGCRAFTDSDGRISGTKEFNGLEPLELGETGAIWEDHEDHEDHPTIIH